MPYFENICDDCGSPTIPSIPIVIPPINSCCVWGKITGSLTDQIDLNTALNNKFNVPVGTTSQYIRGNGTLATLPTFSSTWGGITGTLSAQTDLNTALTTITTAITALQATKFNNPTGTTSQYIKGDGSLGTLPASAIPVWGTITGTLSNQTDLQTAFNAKFNNPTGTVSQYLRGDGSTAIFPTIPAPISFASQIDNENAAIESNALVPNASNVENGKITSPQGLFYFIQKLKLQNISWNGFHTFLNGLNIQTSNPNSINKQVGVDVNGNVVLVPVSGAALVVAGQVPSEDAVTNATITAIDNTSYASPRSLRYFIEKVKAVVNTWTGLNIFTGGVRIPSITTVNIAADGAGNFIASPDVNLATILFVSKSGNDTTGQKGNIKRPYLTLTKANIQAVAGDTIWVLDGVYNENNLTANLISYYFPYGTGVDYNPASPSVIADYYSIFKPSASINIYGQGAFNYRPQTPLAFRPLGSGGAILESAGMVSNFYADTVTSSTGLFIGCNNVIINNIILNVNAIDYITLGGGCAAIRSVGTLTSTYLTIAGTRVQDTFTGINAYIKNFTLVQNTHCLYGRGFFIFSDTLVIGNYYINNYNAANEVGEFGYSLGYGLKYTSIDNFFINGTNSITNYVYASPANPLVYRVTAFSKYVDFVFDQVVGEESFYLNEAKSLAFSYNGNVQNVDLKVYCKVVYGSITHTKQSGNVHYYDLTYVGGTFTVALPNTSLNVFFHKNVNFVVGAGINTFVLASCVIYNYGNINTDSTLANTFGGASTIINTASHATKGLYVNAAGDILRETLGDVSRGLYSGVTRSGVVTL